jgi:hypothetical protein
MTIYTAALVNGKLIAIPTPPPAIAWDVRTSWLVDRVRALADENRRVE